MKEIDIIELLKRAKEGNAPKEIAINNSKFEFFEDYIDINSMYECIINGNKWVYEEFIDLDTSIKILDKPIIDKLNKVNSLDDNRALIIENRDKINKIIDWINNREEN